MGQIHLEQAKYLRQQGKRLGRAGMSERVVQAVKDWDGSYKGAMILAGRLKAIAHAAKSDGYWDEKVFIGYQLEVNTIHRFTPTAQD